MTKRGMWRGEPWHVVPGKCQEPCDTRGCERQEPVVLQYLCGSLFPGEACLPQLPSHSHRYQGALSATFP